MDHYDIIVIGAGASGLMAAYQLSATGKQVLILEARDRIGGRARTISGNGFTRGIETGAEFVHGKLPLTLSLLKLADLDYQPIKGKSFTIKKGQLSQEDNFGTDWHLLMKQLKNLTNDVSIEKFLNTHFSADNYNELKQSVLRFVQGFDAAEPTKVSSFSLRNEWMKEDDGHQYRIEKGYTALMQWMADECVKNRTTILLSHVVKHIRWQRQPVSIECSNDKIFTAEKVLITIPLGVWQAGTDAASGIIYTPAIARKQEAAMELGYGSVIKVNIEFTDPFWENNRTHTMRNAGFIFSDSIFPTWWTQNPVPVPQLSGWLAGPPSEALKELSPEALKEKAIESLAYIFGTDKQLVTQKTKACIVTNWGNDPFARGAYSYDTLQSTENKKILNEPVENILFFAGEAVYNGPDTGTVEAAFSSGKAAVKEIMAVSDH